MSPPSHPFPPEIPPFSCFYNAQRSLLASERANGFFSIQMILELHGIQYHTTILRAQLPHPISALTWISSNAVPPCGSLFIGFRNGLIHKLDFFVDDLYRVCWSCQKCAFYFLNSFQISHIFVPIHSCDSAVVSLVNGLDGLLSISASGHYFVLNVPHGQTGINDSSASLPTEKGVQNAGFEPSSPYKDGTRQHPSLEPVPVPFIPPPPPPRARKRQNRPAEGLLQPEPNTGRGYRVRQPTGFYRKLNEGEAKIPRMRNFR